MANESAVPADCLLAEQVICQPYAQFCRCVLLLCNLSSSLLFAPLLLDYSRKRVTLHGNLKLIYVNVAIQYGLVGPAGYYLIELRNLFVSLADVRSPCEMRTPLWYVLVSKVTANYFETATPLLHFALMAERVRATMLVKRYEAEGRSFGTGALLTVHSLTALFMGYLAYTALLLNGFDLASACAVNILTNQYNSRPLLVEFYAQLVLIFCTTVGDYLVMRANRARQRVLSAFKHSGGRVLTVYSLSENYQLRENIRTIQLIFPLDMAYFAFLGSYIVCVCVLRTVYANDPDMSPGTFMAHYNLLNCIATLYNSIALVYFRRFLVLHKPKGAAKPNEICPKLNSSKKTDLHFSQLKAQWND